MSDAENGLVHLPRQGNELYRASTDAAGLCKEIVVRTAMEIQGRKYVRVEGWQSIAVAHGCFASSGEVERVNDPDCPGYRAVGKVIRADNGQVLATAEGFVGDDEKTWKTRPAYAKRAMAQTRAISRACRSAFAHVVVMMGAGLETTPAEEVPHEGFAPAPADGALEDKLKASIEYAKKTRPRAEVPREVRETIAHARSQSTEPSDTVMNFGKHKGSKLSELDEGYLKWLAGSLEESVQDPGKEQYAEKNQALLDAVTAELEKR